MPKNSKKRSHWSSRVHEVVLTRDKHRELSVQIRGGAELGQFPLLGALDGVTTQGKATPSRGELLLEVNDTPVAGLTTRDVMAVLKHCKDPVRLKCVKTGELQPEHNGVLSIAQGVDSIKSRLYAYSESRLQCFSQLICLHHETNSL